MADIPPPPLTEKAQRLLGVIFAAIKHGEVREGEPETFLSYSSALERLGFSSWRHAGWTLSRAGLRDLARWTENYQSVPKVDALIVTQGSHRPGDGFRKIHGKREWDDEVDQWWLAETSRAIHFDWSPFVRVDLKFLPISKEAGGLSVREDEEPDVPFEEIVVVEPPPAHIRQSRITVGDILQWLATGQTEAEILRQHTELRIADIRASLSYAAEREKKPTRTEEGMSRLSAVASGWAGKLKLPDSDPNDPRMSYLLERYWRHRR